MKRLAAVALGAALFLSVAVAGSAHRGALKRSLVLRGPSSTSPLLGLEYGRTAVWLARLDRRTLKIRPGRRLALVEYSGGWSYSPDRSQLAFGSYYSATELVAVPARLRVVDPRTLRTVRYVPLGINGAVAYVYWATPNRLLAVVEGPRESPNGSVVVADSVVVVDPSTGSVLVRSELNGKVGALDRADGALVLLLQEERYGPVRLVVADAAGGVRSVRLERIEAGSREMAGEVLHDEGAAVAVDRVGRRAYAVAPAGNLVAEVDLDTLAVGYHGLAQPVSLLGRLHDWLEPAAQAKGPLEGSWRYTTWLGDGRLAVVGRDASAYSTGEGLQVRQRPSGLIVIDTRDWSASMIDSRSSALVVANGALLSWGWGWDSGTQRETGTGLNLYDRAGLRRFHLFGARVIYDVQVVGPRAFVRTRALYGRYAVVSVRTGRQVRTVRGDGMPLVLSSAGPRFYR
jgi:hypothetical protein